MAGHDGMLGIIYSMGITNQFFPLLIFMGVGAMTDFGPLLANPKTALLGGAAQFGIFGSLVGAVLLAQFVPGINFTLEQAAAISIIGGARITSYNVCYTKLLRLFMVCPSLLLHDYPFALSKFT